MKKLRPGWSAKAEVSALLVRDVDRPLLFTFRQAVDYDLYIQLREGREPINNISNGLYSVFFSSKDDNVDYF
jgi:hypothetical protein